MSDGRPFDATDLAGRLGDLVPASVLAALATAASEAHREMATKVRLKLGNSPMDPAGRATYLAELRMAVGDANPPKLDAAAVVAAAQVAAQEAAAHALTAEAAPRVGLGRQRG